MQVELPKSCLTADTQTKEIIKSWPTFSTVEIYAIDGSDMQTITVESRDAIAGLNLLYDKVCISTCHKPRRELGFLSVPTCWVLRIQSTIEDTDKRATAEWSAGFTVAKRAQQVLPGQHDIWLIADPVEGLYLAIFNPMMAIDRRHHAYSIRQIKMAIPTIGKRHRAGQRGYMVKVVDHLPLPNQSIKAVQFSQRGWTI